MKQIYSRAKDRLGAVNDLHFSPNSISLIPFHINIQTHTSFLWMPLGRCASVYINDLFVVEFSLVFFFFLYNNVLKTTFAIELG